MFFSRYYGSTDEAFPQRIFSTDDRQRFEARLTGFCAAVARSLRDRGREATALELGLVKLRRQGDVWTVVWGETVGACNPISSPFRSAAP